MNPGTDTLWPLWLELARARAAALEWEVAPWESVHPAVRKVWQKLILPENRAALEASAVGARGMNPAAAEAVRRVLDHCRRKGGSQAGLP